MTSRLPLDSLHIASPCGEPWNAMKGDQYVRFCGRCQKNVYNLSALTASEAIDLIHSRAGKICVTYYRRKDGTVLTADCPVGVKAAARRRIQRLTKIAAALLSLWGISTALQKAGSWPCIWAGHPDWPLQRLRERITAAFSFVTWPSNTTAMPRATGEISMGTPAFPPPPPPTSGPSPGTTTTPDATRADPGS
jgi:hypothetical protein